MKPEEMAVEDRFMLPIETNNHDLEAAAARRRCDEKYDEQSVLSMNFSTGLCGGTPATWLILIVPHHPREACKREGISPFSHRQHKRIY